MVRVNFFISKVDSDPEIGFDSSSRYSSPTESKIRNLLWAKKWMEMAFIDIHGTFEELESSNSLLLNDTKRTPPSFEFCLIFTGFNFAVSTQSMIRQCWKSQTIY